MYACSIEWENQYLSQSEKKLNFSHTNIHEYVKIRIRKIYTYEKYTILWLYMNTLKLKVHNIFFLMKKFTTYDYLKDHTFIF